MEGGGEANIAVLIVKCVHYKDIARHGNDGIGKPETLHHRDGWSRRIDDANRLVYQISADGSIEILQCKGHYDD
jgi:toxin YoeB